MRIYLNKYKNWFSHLEGVRNQIGMLLLSLACILTVLGFAEEALLVQEGSPFSVSLPVQIPQGSLSALRTYLDFLIAARPIPKEYLLESYKIDTEKNAVELTGRVIKDGACTLFLGAYIWDSKVIVLPPVKINAQPLAGIVPSPKDMLLPYPELVFKETKKNSALRKELFDGFLLSAESVLRKQKNFKRGIIGFLLVLAVSPVLFFTLGRKIEGMKKAERRLSPQEELVAVKDSKDWTKLLALLQRLSEKEEYLTSYELGQYFSQKGKKDLEQASLFIERYGYLSERSLDQFDEAVGCVAGSFNLKTAVQ